MESFARLLARDVVVERLRAWIIDGSLAPGETIKDTEIADTLGVSRTPVREALLQLEREGLIESQPGRWTRVAALDLSAAEKLYPVVIELEALALRMAAERPERDLHRIERAQRDFATAVSHRKSDAKAIRAADDRFHGEILALADNAYISETLLPLKAIVRRYENYFFASHPELAQHSVDDHAAMLAAIQQRDAEGAARASRRHWERSFVVLHDSARELVAYGG
jgi:DNA-binding GntR family transcriptional regulator